MTIPIKNYFILAALTCMSIGSLIALDAPAGAGGGGSGAADTDILKKYLCASDTKSVGRILETRSIDVNTYTLPSKNHLGAQIEDTLLTFAARHSNTKMIDCLISKWGANKETPNFKNRIGFFPAVKETPLFVAITERRFDIAAHLHRLGCNINVSNGLCSPLHVVATTDSFTADDVALLISWGANVNSLDGLGGTPLTWAAQKNNPDKVSLLLKNGAETNVVDLRGKTAEDWARTKKHTQIIQLLTNSAARIAWMATVVRSVIRGAATEGIPLGRPSQRARHSNPYEEGQGADGPATTRDAK